MFPYDPIIDRTNLILLILLLITVNIGRRLKLPKEPSDPFSYLGLVSDFNGIDIEEQSKEYIQISCPNFIDRLLRSHGWKEPRKMKPISKPIGPLPTNILQHSYKSPGPAEGTAEHCALEEKSGFAYRMLLGEMIYAYITYRPDG